MPQNRRFSNAGDVPEFGHPDRSRVLNVMAQRRYRQRQREKLRSRPGHKSQGVSSGLATEVGNLAQSVELPMLHTSNSESRSGESLANLSGLDVTPYDFGPDPSTLDCDPTLWVYGLENNTPSNLSEPNYSMVSASDTNPMVHCETEDFRSEFASLELSQFTFPDESQLEIPVLKVLKVSLTIAQLLGCADSIWDPTISRVLDKDQLPGTGSYLPPNLIPTAAQKRFPHHPLLDILPWPSVRTKFVCVFAQPPQLRPPIARGPMALMQLLFDLDDEAEGIRIVTTDVNGADALDQKNWEIGQTFFQNWWWALDQGVINNSNALRKRRGAERLTLTP